MFPYPDADVTYEPDGCADLGAPDLAADAYRRRIRVETTAPGVVVSQLEDDFHFFVVTLRHDGERIEEVTCAAHRWPWTTCPDAASLAACAGGDAALATVHRGRCVDGSEAELHPPVRRRVSCDHAAPRGRRARQYDVEVPRRDFDDEGRTRVRLWVDGALDLSWSLDWNGIVDPAPPFDAAPWRGGFMRWADTNLPEDDAECAITLRRAADIGMGRGMDLDGVPVASQLPASMGSVCYSMQPDVVEVAFRHRGSIRDFAAHPERLLAD